MNETIQKVLHEADEYIKIKQQEISLETSR